MTANKYHSKRHKYFPPRAYNGERRKRFPLRWPNYTEDDIEWITYTGCACPDSACEVCSAVSECLKELAKLQRDSLELLWEEDYSR